MTTNLLDYTKAESVSVCLHGFVRSQKAHSQRGLKSSVSLRVVMFAMLAMLEDESPTWRSRVEGNGHVLTSSRHHMERCIIPG